MPPIEIDWNALRPFGDSKNDAFEELCSQLAASEDFGAGSRFHRNGRPDAGIECLWRTANGDEYCWQAKWFRESPGSTQWKQVKESFDTAFEKSPRMVRFTLCMPIDLPDARQDGTKSAREKWEALRAEWQDHARQNGRENLEIAWWGSSEICDRLARDQHRGRRYFWFGTQEFHLDWFKRQTGEAIRNAGPRYRPELNVATAESRYFDAIALSGRFFESFADHWKEVKRHWPPSHPPVPTTEAIARQASKTFDQLEAVVRGYLVEVSTLPDVAVPQGIDWPSLVNAVGRVRKALDKWENAARNIESDGATATRTENSEFHYRARVVARHLDELTFRFSDDLSRLANDPALLLIGEAGQGKTHLFCHSAKTYSTEGHPCLLFHGFHFESGEPLGQMIQRLGLNCPRDEFLGALESAAQSSGKRALLFIDALNETDDKQYWKKNFAGLLAALQPYRWIGVAFSIRSCYLPIVPDLPSDCGVVRVAHRGFAGRESQACDKYFAHYGIQPTTPPFSREFSNPLLLTWICECVQMNNLTHIPLGWTAITRLHEYFLESVNAKLAQELDYDKTARHVQRAVHNLARDMASSKRRSVARSIAKSLIDSICPSSSYERSLFRRLIAEGILLEDHHRGEHHIRFTYERFGDHAIASQQLEEFEIDNATDYALDSTGPLGWMFSNWDHQGLLESLSIQIPEKLRRELVDLAPSQRQYLRAPFLESLFWRSHQSISDRTLALFNELGITNEERFELQIAVSAIPGHPLNARSLHSKLLGQTMPDRDATWSIWLHYAYSEDSILERLIDWSVRQNDKSGLDDEARVLTGTVLAWFFTSANRFLRDRAIKGVVRLFESRIDLLCNLLGNFRIVNDPYVIDGLVAVAYGCALRSEDGGAICRLAQLVFDWVFEDGSIRPHILIRDHARGVVERAVNLGSVLNFDIAQTRPPYASEWPGTELLADDALLGWKDWQNQPHTSQHEIYCDLMGSVMSDFSQYQADSLQQFLDLRIGSDAATLIADFVRSLDAQQRRLYDDLSEWIAKTSLQPTTLETVLATTDDEWQFLRSGTDARVSALVNSLGTDEDRILVFDGLVKPNLGRAPGDAMAVRPFDRELAGKWMMGRVIELGWNAEGFGEFDDRADQGQSDRSGYSHRIGSKYAFIALHELLARLSDHFVFSNHQGREYEGPWQLSSGRRSDPSMLLPKTCQKWSARKVRSWWSGMRDCDWEQLPEADWLKAAADLPDIKELIRVKDPAGGRWVVLESAPLWEAPPRSMFEEQHGPKRHLSLSMQSFLVSVADGQQVQQWLANQWDPVRSKLPAPPSFPGNIYLGEYFWARAFKSHDGRYHGREDWTRLPDFPADVLVATDSYYRECGADNSLEETVNITLPCRFIVEELGLRWRGREGAYEDDSKRQVAFDPSVEEAGPRASLIDESTFRRFLKEKGLVIVWAIQGQKLWITRSLEFRGKLVVRGGYVLTEDAVAGSIATRFLGPPSEPEQQWIPL